VKTGINHLCCEQNVVNLDILACIQCVVAVQSIEYDVDLDFLLNSPKAAEKSVSIDESVQNDTLVRPAPPPSTYEDDCLISPVKPGTAVVGRPAKVPSVDRSTKPSSATQNNSVTDTAVSSSQSAASITRINNKLTSDKNIDGPNNVSDAHLLELNKPAPGTVDQSARFAIPPPAPDRSTKPVGPPVTSSSDVNAQLEKEQAELNILQAKKMQEAAALANMMREKRKLEMEKKKLVDGLSRTE